MNIKIFSIIALLPSMALGYDSVGNMGSNEKTYDNANRILSDSVYTFIHDAASMLFTYPYAWTPAFPMFLPLDVLKKKPVECRID